LLAVVVQKHTTTQRRKNLGSAADSGAIIGVCTYRRSAAYFRLAACADTRFPLDIIDEMVYQVFC
jgi:hypothetical protein